MFAGSTEVEEPAARCPAPTPAAASGLFVEVVLDGGFEPPPPVTQHDDDHDHDDADDQQQQALAAGATALRALLGASLRKLGGRVDLLAEVSEQVAGRRHPQIVAELLAKLRRQLVGERLERLASNSSPVG